MNGADGRSPMSLQEAGETERRIASALAYGYPAPAVAVVILVGGIFAASDHTAPDCAFAGVCGVIQWFMVR